jgi:hypothetical protein
MQVAVAVVLEEVQQAAAQVAVEQDRQVVQARQLLDQTPAAAAVAVGTTVAVAVEQAPQV